MSISTLNKQLQIDNIKYINTNIPSPLLYNDETTEWNSGLLGYDTNYALASNGSTATATSTYPAGVQFDPSNAIDGFLDDGINQLHYWLTADFVATYTHSLTVDLGTSRTINTVVVYNCRNTIAADRGTENYRIGISTDNITFTIVNTGVMVFQDVTTPYTTTFIPRSVRYIKFYMDTYYVNSGGLAELQAFYRYDLQGVAWSPELNVIVGVRGSGNSSKVITSGDNGKTWVPRTTPPNSPPAPNPMLYNTGVDDFGVVLPSGTIGDPHYKLISVPSGTMEIRNITSASGFPIPPWAGDTSLSSWIGTNTPALDSPVGTYVFRTTCNLSGYNISTTSITGSWSVDNSGSDILVNGVSTGQTQFGGFGGFAPFTIASGYLISGINIIDFYLYNGGGPGGLRVEMSVTGTVINSVTDSYWYSVAWSGYLQMFAAVAYSPNTSLTQIMTSPDGITWTEKITPWLNHNWTKICWSDDLRIFVAVDGSTTSTNTKRSMYSKDGINWLEGTTPAINVRWNDVVWSAQLGLFAAVSSSGNTSNNGIMTSPDGILWTLRTHNSTTTTLTFGGVVWSPELSLFVALSNNTSTPQGIRSSNGITWYAFSIIGSTWQRGTWCSGLNKFIFINNDSTYPRSYESQDGYNWDITKTTLSSKNDIIWAPELNKAIAVGSSIDIYSPTIQSVTIPQLSFANRTPIQGLSTTIDRGSNGLSLPQSTIYVKSTEGFPKQGSLLIPSVPSTGSLFFNGNDGGNTAYPYFSVSNTESLRMRTGDFTIEWFQYLIPNQLAPRVFSIGVFPTAIMAVSWEGPGNEALAYWNATGGHYTANSQPVENVWAHIAISRTNGTTTIYRNGVLLLTFADTVDYNEIVKPLLIGNETTASGTFYYGNITNFRIIKGYGLYTTAFSPPISPFDPKTPGTVLLLSSESTTTRYLDSSSFGQTIGKFGTGLNWNASTPYSATITQSVTKLQTVTYGGIIEPGGSMYFNGVGPSYPNLSITNSSNVRMGTGDFTIEWFQYLIPGAPYPRIFTMGNFPDTSFGVSIEPGLDFRFWYGSGPIYYAVTITETANSWHHFAISRTGTTLKIFQNGLIKGTFTNSTDFSDNVNEFMIGAQPDFLSTTPFTGYITNMRIVKGYGLYVSPFTIPNAPLEAVPGTTLLLRSTNNAGLLTDSSVFNQTVTNNNRVVWKSLAPPFDSGFTGCQGGSGTLLGRTFTGSDFLSWGTQAVTITALNGIGTLTISGSGFDPFIFTYPNLFIADYHRYLKIKVKNNFTTTVFQFFFGTLFSGFSEPQSFTWVVSGFDSSFKEYTIDLSSNSLWTGVINAIRLDIGSGALGETFDIEYLQLLETPLLNISPFPVITDDTNSSWQAITLSDNIYDIAWSPELNLMVGVSDTTSGYRILTSKDGETWTRRVTPADQYWYGKAWSKEVGFFVATSADPISNAAMTSPDGINWTSRSTPGSNHNWTKTIWVAELSLFISVDYSNTSTTTARALRSADGITWIESVTPNLDRQWIDVVWSPQLKLLVAVSIGGNSGDGIMTSSDGINWISQSHSLGVATFGSCAWSPDLGIFVILPNGGYYGLTSLDGITWTTMTMSIPTNWFGVCWASTLKQFIAIDLSSAFTAFSNDGKHWSLKTSSAGNLKYSVVWVPELTMAIECGKLTATNIGLYKPSLITSQIMDRGYSNKTITASNTSKTTLPIVNTYAPTQSITPIYGQLFSNKSEKASTYQITTHPFPVIIGPNLALTTNGATASATSAYPGFPASNAIDGILEEGGGPNYYWLTADSTLGDLTIDLLISKTINTIALVNCRNNIYFDRGTQNYRLGISTDNITYTMVNTGGTLTQNDITTRVITSFPDTSARYVKLFMDSFYGNSGGLGEIEIFHKTTIPGYIDIMELNNIGDYYTFDIFITAYCGPIIKAGYSFRNGYAFRNEKNGVIGINANKTILYESEDESVIDAILESYGNKMRLKLIGSNNISLEWTVKSTFF